LNDSIENIAQCISRNASAHPKRDAIIFLERGETETERLTYEELEARAASYAAGFEREHLSGRAVVIAMPPGGAFVSLFLGCLRAGAIAVPVPFPDSDRNLQRIASVIADARPAAVISIKTAIPQIRRIAAATPVFDHEALLDTGGAMPNIASHQPALIQYTSGSTQAPKGIVITHANLMANQHMIHRGFDLPAGVIGVTWLPHFHDMGLIGTILQPLFLGGTAILMPPRAFVQKPIRWLRAIERYGAHTCGAPSFGYELCTRMIAPGDAAKLDLSNWQRAFCGAEPIRAAVLAQFAQRFAAAGFSEKAFLPCYGLAETTLITAASDPGGGLKLRDIESGHGASRRFVSCGKPVEGSTTLLRDEHGNETAFGEICVGGPHVSPGLWNGEMSSVTPFANTFVEDGKSFLRTGDVGTFVDGELFVVDRIKDVLVLYGAKHHATDIEMRALDHDPDIRAAAAFSVDDGQRERLVVLCELDRRKLATIEHSAYSSNIAKRISEAIGVLPTVQILAYGDLPRTSSGKIQRFAAKTKFLSGAWGVSNVAGGAAVSPTHDE
jgi:acyl-CoA synthetase (AMP-forming)/AMP-acid ligase II